MIRHVMALLLLTASPVAAQSSADMAKKFGSRGEAQGATLSPDGGSLAWIRPNRGKGGGLYIVKIGDPAAPVRVFESNGEPWNINWCDWISNARLVCQLYGVLDQTGTLLGFTRMISFNRDGTQVKLLGVDRGSRAVGINQYDGEVLGWSHNDSSSVVMARNYAPDKLIGTRFASNEQGLGVDLVNTETLDRKKLVEPNRNAFEYLTDTKGEVRIMSVAPRAASGMLTGVTEYYYRKAGSTEWQKFSQSKGDRDGLRPEAVDAARDIAYAWGDKDGRWALFAVKLDGSLTKELVLAHAKVDLDSLLAIGRNGRVIGAQYVTESRHNEVFDPEYKALAARLQKALPGNPTITFTGSSRDEKRLLVSIAPGNDPGRLYLFDKASKGLNELMLMQPELENVKLGETRAISYKAADGSLIPGYLTLPPGVNEAKGLPAIVMPHGGPSARDEAGYDWLVQFFATQGYAVLQPNYRSSSGYGEEWYLENGFKSWRTAIGDVRDAGKWLVSEGVADPRRLAIVGWSYGGYAALQAAAIEPDLFKASVAIAPVTDFRKLVSQAQEYTSGKLVADYVGKGPHLEEGSPVKQAGSIKAPVLMFTGDRDLNVHFSHAKDMDKVLRSLGKSSSLTVYPGLDHQLPDGTVRADMLLKSLEFLQRTMPK